MKIAIIGGGFSGLTTGYYLSQKNYKVVIFEKCSKLGGLAGSFKEKNWQWPLEFYFHHLFPSDKQAIMLAQKLGIKEKIFFCQPKSSIFRNGQIFQFDTPLSVLKSPALSFKQKLRMGLVTAYLKFVSSWQNLEKVTAEDWLKKYYGQRSYQVFWEPLLKAKFSHQANLVSMSWFWARVKKRTARLGYFEGGFQTLIDHLAEQIKAKQGKIILNSEIKKLPDIYRYDQFDKVIATVPPPTLLKIVPGLPLEYQGKINKLAIIGALNLVLVLKEKFLTDNTYWLNINESDFPFVAVVEHTNFIDPQYYGGDHIVYVGGYYPPNHPFFKMTKEKILKEFLPYLKKINPYFDFKLLTLNFELFTNLYAQPVIPTSYSKLIPSFRTPVPNLFLATMHHIYPWDRGVNYAIELGRKLADEIDKEILISKS